MSKRGGLNKSFKYALTGLREAIQKEPNFQIHAAAGTTAIIVAAVIGVTRIEWTILTLTISIVLILELLNTTLEALVDIVSPHHHDSAKLAKDVAAAAVMLGAVTSLIVGAVIFIPHIIELYSIYF